MSLISTAYLNPPTVLEIARHTDEYQNAYVSLSPF